MESDYFDANRAYWEKGYNAPNVDHPAFRFYGRILRPEFGMTGAHHERLLDFGCGQGAAVNYFTMHGFDAVGCDISASDIQTAQTRFPHASYRFQICDPNPKENAFYGFSEGIQVVIGIQSFYYFSDSDLRACLETIHRSMEAGGVFFASMMGSQCREFFENSRDVGDGLRCVNFTNERLEVRDYYMNFTRDEEELRGKFAMFEPRHIGHYAAKLRSDEGDGYHWTFCGVKR